MADHPKKHPCPDCHHCQWCSDERCRLCLKSCRREKLSIKEQIDLYEKLNAAAGERKESGQPSASSPTEP